VASPWIRWFQEEYQKACKRTERAEAEALSAEVALRDERVQSHAAAAKLQDEIDKCTSAQRPLRSFVALASTQLASV
jgi:hypothetical protein